VWDLRELAWRGRSLADRLETSAARRPQISPGGPPGNGDAIERRLARWRRLAACDESGRFERRLAWDGIHAHTLLELLGTGARTPVFEPPACAEILLEAAELSAATPDRAVPSSAPVAPVPFEEICAPFVRAGLNRLEARQPEQDRLLSARARRTLARALLGRLAGVAFRTLNLEFAVSRLRAARATAFALMPFLPPDTDTAYTTFVRQQLDDRFGALFGEYPVLGRLMATTVDQWVESAAELLARLQQDRGVLRSVFGEAAGGPIADLRLALSDPHGGGRGVIEIEFDADLKVMYKPRDLGPEALFQDLLAWGNRAGLSLPLRVLRVLPRNGYGWMECAVASPCPEPEQLHRYYRRAGMLLGVVHALRGTDLHLENTIACGEQPVLVDLETLFSPRVGDQPSAGALGEAFDRAADALRDSVIGTSFLPMWAELGAGPMDVSGLGAIAGREVEVDALEQINTDRMRAVRRTTSIPIGANSPFDDARAAVLTEYAEDLVDGFREATGLLASAHGELLDWLRGRTGAEDCWFRFVLRPTWIYARLLAATTDPRYLRDGVDRSIELDALARACTAREERPALWPAVRAEVAALERMDVPLFRFRAHGAGLFAGDGTPIDNVLIEEPWQTVERRWGALAAEADDQARIIRSAVLGHAAAAEGDDDRARPGRSCAAETEPITERALLDEAGRIARALGARAVIGSDGSVCWMGLQRDPATHRSSYQVLGPGLYSGGAGIILFLDALARVAPARVDSIGELLDGARAWLCRVSAGLLSVAARRADAIDLGAGSGLGSMIYTLATLGDRTDDACLGAALELVALAIPDRAAVTRRAGLLDGAAGAVLALLKLHRVTGADAALDRARLLGRHLLGPRLADGPSPGDGAAAGPGFGRGLDGIAYALARLAGATGERVYRDAAVQALVDAAQGAQGSGVAETSTASAGTGWCRGSAGVLLAHAGGSGSAADPGTHSDLERALERTVTAAAGGPDDLCCGRMGRAAVLVTASRQLSRPDLLDAAHRVAAAAVAEAAAAGAYRFLAGTPAQIDNPGLFSGDAGIGWALLRLARPADVPCVLAME
jgi:type 2 lantibiotic biosynthesis protein LanM